MYTSIPLVAVAASAVGACVAHVAVVATDVGIFAVVSGVEDSTDNVGVAVAGACVTDVGVVAHVSGVQDITDVADIDGVKDVAACVAQVAGSSEACITPAPYIAAHIAGIAAAAVPTVAAHVPGVASAEVAAGAATACVAQARSAAAAASAVAVACVALAAAAAAAVAAAKALSWWCDSKCDVRRAKSCDVPEPCVYVCVCVHICICTCISNICIIIYMYIHTRVHTQQVRREASKVLRCAGALCAYVHARA